MKKINIIILTTTVLLITSCVKETINVDKDKIQEFDRPLFLDAPIAKSYFSATDMISRLNEEQKKHVIINEDGLVSVFYKDSIQAVWNDIVKIKKINLNKNILLNTTKKGIKTNFTANLLVNEKPTQRFDEMKIKKANFNFSITFPNVTGTVEVKFPSITKDGQVLTFNYSLPKSDVSENKNISGYTIVFDHNTAKDSSFIKMEINANITDFGTETNPQINSSIQITDLEPTVMFGYFGKELIINEKKQYIFAFFEDYKVIDLIEFKEITLTAKFDNYFGVPFNGKVKQSTLSRRETAETLSLVFNENNTDSNTVFVKPATYDNKVIPKNDVIILDKTNSNVTEALNFYPDKLTYKIECETNPNEDKQTQNFITSDNKILGNMFIEIPFWIRTQTYTRTDTINDLTFFEDLKENQIKYIDSVKLEFDFYNTFPFNLKTQIYAANKVGVKIDKLFKEVKPVLLAGKTNSEGKVTQETNTKLVISLSKEQVKKYKDLEFNKLLIETHTQTAEGGVKFVKIYENTGIKINLYLSVKSNKLN